MCCIYIICRSLWPRGLRRRSAAARQLRLWVRVPPGAWMFISCECCVLSGRALCDKLITRPEESYRLWCVVVCDLETSWMRRPRPALGRSAIIKRLHYLIILQRWIIGKVAANLRTQGQWQCTVSASCENISLPQTLVWRHLTTYTVDGMCTALYYLRYTKMCGEIRN